MKAESAPPAGVPARRNYALWLVVGLPLAAVIAALASVVVAIRGGDAPLPERYHWEGSQLDADQARLESAARRGISAAFSFDATAGECRIALQGAAPAGVQLNLAHATLTGLDQHVLLQRAGDAYVGHCAPLAPGHWWLEVADPSDGWLLRQRLAR
jgi:hypothetical protein